MDNLAIAIKNYSGAKSIVFALLGPWGSGKSSVLNFIAEKLDEDGRIIVGRFDPWNFSDQHRLLTSFFSFFATLLREQREKEHWFARLLGRIPWFMSEAHKKYDQAAEWLEALADLADSFKVFDVGLAGVAKSSARLARSRAQELAELENVKKKISARLSAVKKRLVIIIDDLDRLTDEEIRQVFQLVKAGADFDNVIYLLAFDRSIVAPALDLVSNGQGGRYLEKVINVSLNVPAMTGNQSRQRLLEALTPYTERQVNYNWNDNERLRLTLVDNLAKYFSTMRLIGLLTNSLVIIEPMVKDDVDFADHIAITALKVLEPPFHDFIAANARLFVDVLVDQFLRDKKADDADKKRILDAMESMLQIITVEDCTAVLAALFPKVRRLLADGPKEWGKREWAREKRICADEEIFRRYFRFQVDESDVSASDVDAIRRSVGSREEFARILTSTNDPRRLNRMIQAVDDLSNEELTPAEIDVIVAGFMNVMDDEPRLPGLDDLFFGAINESIRATLSILSAIPDKHARAEVVLRALRSHPTGIEFPVTLVERLLAKDNKGRSDDRAFDFADEESLRQAAAELVREKVEDGTILDTVRPAYSLYAWLNRLDPNGGPQDVRRVTADNDGRFLKFVNVFTNLTLESHIPTPMDLKLLGKVFGELDLGSRLTSLASSADPIVASEAQRLLRLFEKAKTFNPHAEDGEE